MFSTCIYHPIWNDTADLPVFRATAGHLRSALEALKMVVEVQIHELVEIQIYRKPQKPVENYGIWVPSVPLNECIDQRMAAERPGSHDEKKASATEGPCSLFQLDQPKMFSVFNQGIEHVYLEAKVKQHKICVYNRVYILYTYK